MDWPLSVMRKVFKEHVAELRSAVRATANAIRLPSQIKYTESKKKGGCLIRSVKYIRP